MREDQMHGKPSSKNKTGDNPQNLKKYIHWKHAGNQNMVSDVSIEWLMKIVAYFLNKNKHLYYRVTRCARIYTCEKNDE